MARYRKIDPRIHNDSKFCSLSLEGRYLFMFVLTHPNMTSLGAFRTTKESLISELKGLGEGFTEGFMKGFDEVCEKGLLKYDEKACLLFATNFIKYNQPENPNVVKGWLVALDFLPECALLVDVLKTASSVADALFSKGNKPFNNPLESVIETLSKEFCEPFEKGLAKSLAKQEQEQEYISTSFTNVQEVDSAPRAKKHSVGGRALTTKFAYEALPDDWRDYCLEIRPDLNPDQVFVAFKGYWTMGKGKGTIRSEKGWTQSWMTWVRKEDEPKAHIGNSMQFRPARGPKEPEQDFSSLDYGQAGAF